MFYSFVILAALCAVLFPPFAHKLPYYPEALEKGIAAFYEARDDSRYSLFTFLSKLEVVKPVNRGGHFEKFLPGENEVKGRRYFEGWYYKVVSKDMKTIFVAIPGVFFDGRGKDDHAFIMTILADGPGKPDVAYSKFDLKDAKLTNLPKDTYRFEVKGSTFSNEQVVLDIPGIVRGQFNLINIRELPSTMIYPDIMGWFSYLDAVFGMQCVHKVVTLDAELSGYLEYNGETLDLTGGRAYVEGDYGSEFPSKYVWIESNHFQSNLGSSLMLSIANIPFPNNEHTMLEFTGFLGFLYDAQRDQVYRFGTYTGATAHIEGFEKSQLTNKSSVEITIEDAQYILKVEAKGVRDDAALLWGPRVVDEEFVMKRYVKEMLHANAKVKLINRKDYSVLFDDVGTSGGLEIEL